MCTGSVVGVGHSPTRWRSSSPEGHLHRIDHELGSDVIGDRPTHHPPAPGVENDRQIDLAFRSRVLGDVHHPQPVPLGRVEVALHQVLGRGGIGITPGAAPEFPPVDAHDGGLGHEAGHPFPRAALTLAQDELAWTRGDPYEHRAIAWMSNMALVSFVSLQSRAETGLACQA